MKRWWRWVITAIVLGIAAGALTTLITDRAWSSELVPRCVMFSVLYGLMGPGVAAVRRRVEREYQQHVREAGHEDVREDQRGQQGHQGREGGGA